MLPEPVFTEGEKLTILDELLAVHERDPYDNRALLTIIDKLKASIDPVVLRLFEEG